MSLLLDALKRAEQEKLAKQSDRPANEAAAVPANSAATRREPANGPSLELQPIGSGAAAPPSGAQAKAAAGAATAQAVFQAKSAAPRAEGKKNAMVFWIAGGVILVAILGIGGYVWWSLNSLQPQITTLRPRAAPTPPPASGGPPLQQRIDTLVPGAIAPRNAPASSDAPAGGTPAPAPSPAPSQTPATTPGGATTTAGPITTLPSRAAAPSNTELAARLVKEAPPAPSLRLTPVDKPRVAPEILAGYDALRMGDMPASRRAYAAAVAGDPASLDATLGLATVEARMGNVPAAASLYRRALDLDPRNATAIAGLASLADMSQPEYLENSLRNDISRYPQSAALHFALGNLYAARARWEDAQSAFFEALRLEPASADITYNLAVAMDHMGQQRLAADYYRRAIEAARGQSAQFDPAQAARRLAELRP